MIRSFSKAGEHGEWIEIQGVNSIRNFFPGTDAALESVVSIRLVSVASSRRFSVARMVCIFFCHQCFGELLRGLIILLPGKAP